MTRLLGYQGIAFIIKYLFDDVVKQIIQTDIARICEVCLDAFQSGQHVIKRPRSNYGSLAVATFYFHHLKDIVVYKQLKAKFLPKFAQVGNAIVFAMNLEQALNQEEITDLLIAAPFQQFHPPPYVKPNSGITIEQKMHEIREKYRSLDFLRTIGNLGTQTQLNLAQDGDTVTRERLCCGLSIFNVVLNKLKDYLTNVKISNEEGRSENPFIFKLPENAVLQTYETKGFHKLWSAIQFALIAQHSDNSSKNDNTDEAMFGDSVYWAAATIIFVLDQHKLFNAFDFSYHVRQVYAKDMQKENNSEQVDIIAENNYSLGEFSRRTYTVQSLMNEVFTTLDRVQKTGPEKKGSSVKVNTFKPPKFDPSKY